MRFLSLVSVIMSAACALQAADAFLTGNWSRAVVFTLAAAVAMAGAGVFWEWGKRK